MLAALRFRTGRTVSAEVERAETLMTAAGLRSDNAAVRAGLDLVARWVREGRRTLSKYDVAIEVGALGLDAGPPQAILLVQAIARDPHPDDATIALDWVDLFDGDSPPTRRVPHQPDSWAAMQADVHHAADQFRAAGVRDVLVRGAMRQATFFLIGAELAQVTGVNISYRQQHALWSSTTRRIPVPDLDLARNTLNAGSELAVALGIAVDPTGAVLHWITETSLPVHELVTALPAGGPHDQTIASPGEAVAYAQSLRNLVRAELARQPAGRVHLFLAGPGGLALLTGHRWNRVAPTTVYEDRGAGLGYQPAFTIDA